MRYGLDLPNFGDFWDVGLIAKVAEEAEGSGWDGVFLWDHIARSTAFPPGLPTADVTVALTAIALATERIIFGTLVTPLPRRRPHKIARELTSLDHLSKGRLVLGVGIGSPADSEFEAFGEDADLRTRGDRLDESLEVITSLWSGERVDFDGDVLHVHTEGFAPRPMQRPRIPIWVGARWPGKGRTLRRAARWDGFVPTPVDPSVTKHLSPADISTIREELGRDEIDIVVISPQPGMVAEYAAAGTTWWVQVASNRDSALTLAANGPPR